MTSSSVDFDAARRAMIDSQLRTSGVNEPWVLARIAAVAREDFVPAEARAVAYIDRSIPLPDGGVMGPPLFHARLIAEAKPKPTDRVLVVDGGSGYLPALLQGLVKSVEVISPAQALDSHGGGSVALMIIDGAVEHIPDVLAERLADDGRVVTGVIEAGVTRLAIGRKTAGTIALLPLAEMGIPRLAAFDKRKAWSF
jgi:protein-L-isoaspartate(D-aspartate) O-methyltransferase